MESIQACEFCDIVQGSAPAVFVGQNDGAVAFLDTKPASFGHTLIVPRQHRKNFIDATDADISSIIRLTRQLSKLAVPALNAGGFNIVHSTGVAAYQTVFHLHFHLVPRYEGDEVVVFPRPGRKDELKRAGLMIRRSISGTPHE